MDMGGTSLKSAILNQEGKILNHSFSKDKINENGSLEEIIKNMSHILRKKLNQVKNFGELAGLGFSVPGPFDYERGISLMMHKYRSIYNINLKEEIIKSLELPHYLPVLFEEDSIAFLKGEAYNGNAVSANRIIGLTLGKGLGSAFMVKGKIVKDSALLPANGELWCLPHHDGIIEDNISRRGIIKIYKRISRDLIKRDVKDIASQAKSGDPDALQTFKEFGEDMGCLLKPHIKRFRGEVIVIGGQIAKGFDLFAESLTKALRDVPSLRKITPAKYIDLSVFFGIYTAF